MTISIKDREALEHAAKRLADAAVAYSWAGAGHPEDAPGLAEENLEAEDAFRALLDSVTEAAPPAAPPAVTRLDGDGSSSLD